MDRTRGLPWIKASRCFRVLDEYKWDAAAKIWRSVGFPHRAYDPKIKKFVAFKEFRRQFYGS